jgi:microcystin-dependent protein
MRKILFITALAVSALAAGPVLADQPYVGEIRMFGSNYCPQGWIAANGALLPIMQYTPLFSMLGTTYGGDGRVSFRVPNLVIRTSAPQPPTAVKTCIATQGAQAPHASAPPARTH